MKKKFLSLVLIACFILPCMFMLSACGSESKVNVYDITMINGVQGGTILPHIETETQSIQVAEGENYSVIIVPDEGYKIVGLLIDGEIINKDLNESMIYTFENISADHSIAGIFEPIKLPPTIKSIKLEGFKLTYKSSYEQNNTLGSLAITQNFKQNNGYDFIYNSEPVNINNTIKMNSGNLENNIRYYKFSETDIANNIVFFDECADLSVYCSTTQQGTWGGILNEKVVLKSSDLLKINSSIYEDIYSYTIKNTTTNNNYKNIQSIELIFTVNAWDI